MSSDISAYEKGLALELKLHDLFKKKGYNVTHNVKREGRSGTKHQIDILAEYRCPLHTSQVIIEAKSYEKSIDKDRIMKLIQIVDDLGADRGIIITTSSFTSDAIKTAEGHNIDLWNREHLTKLLGEIEVSTLEKQLMEEVEVTELVVLPRLPNDEAKKLIIDRLEQRASGGFLGKGKIVETLDSISLEHHPYYEVDMQAKLSETRKVGWRGEETVSITISFKANVDATTGELVTLDPNGIAYPYGYLRSLDVDEISALRAAVPQKKHWILSVNKLLGLGYSEGKARRIMKSLEGKGVISYYRGAGSLKVQFPNDPRLLRPISTQYSSALKSERDMSKTSRPSKDASAVIKALESYWTDASAGKINTIYYPYFMSVLVTGDGASRIEPLDAVTGIINEDLGKRLTPNQ